MKNKILEIKNLSKDFAKPGKKKINILQDINLDFFEGEILGILGRSGCGKSTILRLITDLIPPTSGEVLLNGKPVNRENGKISMVFQTFGLFPWLTVSDNIALGLKSRGMNEEFIAKKVDTAIKLVGLGGFEEAFPKELSGGMRQRVGFARAIAVDPEILVLDEPFSALDYLTATILKADLLDLWFERSISSIKSIILVTHSIEEALSLCDRIVLLSSHPGKIIDVVDLKMPHPRDHESEAFKDLQYKIYSSITKQTSMINNTEQTGGVFTNYPQLVSLYKMITILEALKEKPFSGKAAVDDLTAKFELDFDSIIAIVESLSLLKFIDFTDNLVTINSSGNILLDADDLAKKQIFKEHIVNNVQLIRDLHHIMITEARSIYKKEIMKILLKKFDQAKSDEIFEATISWIRYAELATYNDLKQKLELNN